MPRRPDGDGEPAPPADVLAEDRPGERRDEERIDREDRVGADQAEEHEGEHGDADLDGEEHAADDLHPEPRGARRPGGCRPSAPRRAPTTKAAKNQ